MSLSADCLLDHNLFLTVRWSRGPSKQNSGDPEVRPKPAYTVRFDPIGTQ